MRSPGGCTTIASVDDRSPSAAAAPSGSTAPPSGTLTLGAILGQGALASVVRLTDANGSAFAGKILHASHGHDTTAQQRFAQEAELARRIVHPNVVRVFGRQTIDTHQVLVMELVDGQDLGDWLVANPQRAAEPETMLGIVRGIAEGLAAAHAAGIVHRDLKPANVLLATGPDGTLTPKIADFGMARAATLSGVSSDAMTVLGTPDYMAPESLDPLAVDSRTDLYALGCIAFEMLTGRPPYHAATPYGLLGAHRSAPIPDLPDTVDAALRELIVAMLAKSPADRPQAAAAIATRLGALQSGSVHALAVAQTGFEFATCTRCGAPLHDGLTVCLGCSLPVVRMVDGEHTVLVTGPGDVGEKLDSDLRASILAWLQDNPSLGISPSKGFRRRIPRLPFAVVTKVSLPTADALIASLALLGLQAVAVEGGPWQLPAMRAGVKKVAGRMLAIVGGSFVGLTSTMMQHPSMWLLALAGGAAGVGWSAARSMAHAAVRGDSEAKALPPAVRAALDRAQVAAAGIEHARHRDSLRAVVGRTLALVPAEADHDAALDAELATAIEAATAAAGRLDALDRQLTRLGVSESSEQTRVLLLERDTWSARLLRLLATLDSLAIRTSAAKARQGQHDDDQTLDALRAHVEALEEVQGV